MKRFVMVVSDKGGAGKSVVSRVLAEFYRETETPVLLVDGDGEVGQLVKHLGARGADGRLIKPQPADKGVLHYALNGSATDREKILNVLDYQADNVLIDFPAAGLSILDRTNREFGFLEDIKSEGYTPVFINPITPFGASMRTVKMMISVGGAGCEYVVIRNEMFTDSADDWIVWDGGDGIKPSAGKAAIAERGTELSLPKLRAGAMSLIDEFSMSFSEAAMSQKLPRYHRNAVRLWRANVFQTLAQIAPLIGVNHDSN